MNTSIENIVVYTEFTKMKVFEQLTLVAASSARRRHDRQKVLSPECDPTGRRVMMARSSSLSVRSPENETTVNLQSASFVAVMLLHGGLTHIQSQIKPWLLFGKSFTLRYKIHHMWKNNP